MGKDKKPAATKAAGKKEGKAKAKDVDEVKGSTGGKLKAANSINVRHILVGRPQTSINVHQGDG